MSPLVLDDQHDVGTTVRLTTMVLNEDPTGDVVRVKDPAGVESFLFPQLDTSGFLFVELVVPVAGQWFYRWESDNPARVRESSFVVRKSNYGTQGTPPPFSDDWAESPWGSFPWPGGDLGMWGHYSWGQIPWGGSA